MGTAHHRPAAASHLGGRLGFEGAVGGFGEHKFAGRVMGVRRYYF